MRENWQPRKLHELGFVGRGRSRHRPRNDPSLYGGPYPFIQTGEIRAADLYLTHFRQTYNEAGLAQSKLWSPGTLCITIAANIAESAILRMPACFPDSVVGFIPFADQADVRFVKYSIDSLKLAMQNISHGTTQDNLSLDKLLLFDIPTPPLPLQRAIADILSAYDDLIENNTRRSANLEERARLLYEEWFVKFRFPGHESVKLVESKMGMVPQGWEMVPLGNVIELAYGKALKAQERTPGKVPVYGSSGIVGYHNKSLVNGPGIIIGRKGNVGTVFWSEQAFYPIDTVFYVKTYVPLSYAYFSLRRQHFLNSDSAIPGLSRHQVYLSPFLKPAHSILKQFEEFAAPLLTQISLLEQANATLRHTRDRLLPGLIAGEIDVASWVEKQQAQIIDLAARRETPLRRVAEAAGEYEPVEREEMEWKSLWE